MCTTVSPNSRRNFEMNVHDGLSEFPPELGFETYYAHSRQQNF